MRLVIFGAGGYIGRRLADKFRQMGVDVICYSSASSEAFDIKTGILSDNVTIPPGTDCVIYLSQSPFYRQMPEMASHLWGVNVVSAIKAAELARHAGTLHFIYASTGNVYSFSFSPLREDDPVRRNDWYALSKVHAEEVLALYGKDMAVSIARIFGVYGPGQTDKLVPNLIRSVRSGVPVKLAPSIGNDQDGGGLKISLCYIDDALDIFSGMLGRPGAGIVNVAGPEVLSIRDIAQSIGAGLGMENKFEVSDQPRTFDLIADTTKLINLFSLTFTPFAEGIRRTLEG